MTIVCASVHVDVICVSVCVCAVMAMELTVSLVDRCQKCVDIVQKLKENISNFAYLDTYILYGDH